MSDTVAQAPEKEVRQNPVVGMIRNYLSLTKPTICLLVLITGAAGLIWEGSMSHDFVSFMLVMLGLFLTAGSANALNQYLERERDAKMKRTARRRVLPTGKVRPMSALIFAVTIGVVGTALYLKPRTAQNIVIGGAAGAMGPVIAWAAATGLEGMTMAPWIMFAIIFLWTPPHFWALALCLQEDYKSNPLPMMPNVAGEDSTLRQMFVYTFALVGISLALIWSDAGLVYIASAVILGGLFIWKSVLSMREKTTRQYWGLFGYSIIYLFALFIAMMIDSAWKI